MLHGIINKQGLSIDVRNDISEKKYFVLHLFQYISSVWYLTLRNHTHS